MSPGRPLIPILLVLAVTIPEPAAAQACGLVGGTGVGAAAGAAHYDLWDSPVALSIGADATLARPAFALRAGYRTFQLGEGSRPHVVRGAAAAPLPLSPAGITLCATAHAGASAVANEDSDGLLVLAGGVGLRVAGDVPLAGARTVPFLEVRTLAAMSSGSALETDVGAAGLSLGIEAGVQAVLGRVTTRLVATLDGFDDGLGVAPYPNATVELGLGLRL